MTTFDDEFAAAFTDILDEFGETTTYRPESGDNRTLVAVITTGELAALAAADNAPAQRALIRLLADPDDATYGGIASSEIIEGRDQIDVVLRDGEAAVPLTVQRILDDSPGVTSLECY